MAILDTGSTKTRILDQAELAYAATGMTDFTLRTLTEQAGVNLASINYHFKSKQALVEAMLSRVLTPLCNEQMSLLCRLQTIYGANLRPTHVLGAALLPLLREIHATRPHSLTHRISFLHRAAMDTGPLIREFIAVQFAPATQAFDNAFAKAAPHLAREDAVWRARLFCSALPGSVNNGNVFAMCLSKLEHEATPWHEVLVHFGVTIEAVMTGRSGGAQVASVVTDMLDSLSSTGTVRMLDVDAAAPALQAQANA